MRDLAAQLVDYARFLDRVVAPVEVPASALRPAQATRPAGRWRRPLLAVGAAFTVTLVAGAVTFLLLGRGEEAPVVTLPTTIPTVTTGPVTSTTAAVTPTTAAGVVSIPADAVFTWARVADTTGALGGEGAEYVAQVIAGGPGLVAVGAADWSPGEEHWGCCYELSVRGWDLGGAWPRYSGGAVWLSADGETWARAADPEGVFGGESGVALLTGVADAGSRLVVVGITATPGGDAGGGLDPRAAVWVSDDRGTSWARVPDDEAAFGGEGRHLMWSVLATDTGFVAAGDDLWTSPDGWIWSRVGPMEEVRRLARTPDGYVAVGLDATTAVAWTSPDGLSWTPAFLPIEAEVVGDAVYTAMTDVVAGSAGVVAVGSQGVLSDMNWDGAAWLGARDGAGSWVRSEPESFARGMLQEIRGVTVVGDRLVAVGTQVSQFAWFGPAQSWASDDGGRTWTYVETEALGGRGDDIAMTTVTTLGNKVIAMGTEGAELAVWIGTWE